MMVEEAIQNAREYPSKMQLWKSLPRQVMYPTFLLVLSYLEQSNKVLMAKDRRIIWIGGNKKLDAAIVRGRRVF